MFGTTTHYKRDALGRVCYKQYTGETNWTEPNSLLPFDEVLYNAAGQKEIIAYMSDGNDLELNMYSYDGFGNLTGAGETRSDFSSSVSYGYDQRGLLTSITYPDEKTVAYTRDALGRIDSVTYDGKLLADYYYLGDTVINKTMTAADIEYEATVDTLGRITGETFNDISTSTAFLTNSYDYTSYSNRMDERNTIDYTFDGLGKLTAEDSTSYTSDILGNPTNASDNGLTYALDNEDRVTQVTDVSGTLGVYDYDRLGRRASKTVDGTSTDFVYDLNGNILAEYEDGNWTQDYIYGAKGEVIYMQLPRTEGMNDEYDEFWDIMTGFASAWLCDPNCTAAQLVYDCNDNDQIDLVDWKCIFDNVDLIAAFTDNGRYVLTDFRNSVIGMTDPNNNVIGITYDAWGAPSYTGDLEGLSIFWNGYYLDDETGNYYLRNRYYSPLERRFVTEDPHGVNPDENLNNSFGINYYDASPIAKQVNMKKSNHIQNVFAVIMIILLGYIVFISIFGHSRKGEVDSFEQLPYVGKYFDYIPLNGKLHYIHSKNYRRGYTLLFATGAVSSVAEIEKIFGNNLSEKTSLKSNFEIPWEDYSKKFVDLDVLKNGTYDYFYTGNIYKNSQEKGEIQLYYRIADGRFICRIVEDN